MSEVTKGRKWAQRIFFGFSGFSGQLAELMANTYLTFFLTNVAMLKASDVAVMFFLTKIFDGITDYLVGIAVDATHSKYGKCRVWMLASIPVIAAGMILIFTSPAGFSYTGKLAWAYVTYMIFTFGLTMSSVAAGAIVPFLSSDPAERSAIVSVKQIFSMVASMVVSGLALTFVAMLGKGDDVAGYFRTSVLFAVVVAVLILSAFLGLKETDTEMGAAIKSNPVKDLIILFTNKNYVVVLLLGLISMLIQITMFSGAIYYTTYVLGDDGKTPLILMTLSIVCMVPMVFMGFFSRKFTKKKLVVIGSVIAVIGYVIEIFAGVNTILLILSNAVIAFGFGFVFMMFFAMQPDLVDDVSYKTGRVMAGLQSALCGFACRLGSAIGSSVLTGLLAWGAYDASLEVQPATAVNAIRADFLLIPVIGFILVVIVVRFYDLDERYAEIRKALDQGKTAAEAAKEE